jgi:isocitrate dehydrogenase (NAD+)
MHKITLIPGDGIGQEITAATQKIVSATGVDIQWDTHVIDGSIDDTLLKSIQENKTVLKGPITTPIGHGFRSFNVFLRQTFNLSTNFRPVQSTVAYKSLFDDIDLIIFRENTEGLYCGVEEMISETEAHSTKIITRAKSVNIIKEAFEYAKSYGYPDVTVVHKANILKFSDGMFLDIAREISESYPDIQLKEMIVDNMCMQLVQRPQSFGVIVTMNLYGDIISDLCAGLVGGLGLIPSANYGDDHAMFEAVHGSAPDIVGKNIANPIALTLSAALMLDHLKEEAASEKIRQAINTVLKEGKTLTPDLGGNATTNELTDRIISFIE